MKQDDQELIEYRITKAFETIKEAEVLIENGFWSASMNRIYYSCFYIVTALLLKTDIKPTTHKGVQQMFGLHYAKTNLIDRDSAKFFSDILFMRLSNDYDDFAFCDEETATNLLHEAKEFILKIEQLIKQ